MHFNKFIALFAFICLSIVNTESPKPQIDIDYQAATDAFTKAKEIKEKYIKFKEKVATNITIEYEKCVQQVKEQKCNNLDQWQSVIEELKLQIQNSKEIETPFLQYRKSQKVERLKQLITAGEEQTGQIGEFEAKLAEYQGFLKDNSKIIEIMYKLPKVIEGDEAAFVQQVDVTRELNANVPDVAGENVQITNSTYNLGDISIQAQASRNVMETTLKNVEETLATMHEVKNITETDQLSEKEKLKESIESLRALIANEQWIQAESQSKIDELEGKIAACQGMPTNIQKDCEPLILKQKKKNAEIDIIQARTMLLFKDLQKVMDENEPDEDIQAHVDSMKAAQEAEFKNSIEQSYLKDEPPAQKSTKLPEELKPIHHMREQVVEETPQQQA